LKTEIELIQQATTDESIVAEALRNFEEVFKVIPFEERLGLMELLFKEIRVSRIEPQKFESDLPKGTFVTQLRTQWYKLEFDFFVTSLFKVGYVNENSCPKGSYLTGNGGEGGTRTGFYKAFSCRYLQKFQNSSRGIIMAPE
jgi:hypothetical protein